MAEKIIQVQVGKTRVGLRGLEEAFRQIQEGRWDSPEQAREELLSRVAARNYIPAGSREDYARALWREYRRFQGERLTPEAPAGLEITLLGLGCAACQGFYQMLMDTVANLGLEAGVQYFTDPGLLEDYGVRPLPALLINGRVALAGRVPAPAELQAILTAARPGK